MSEIANIQIVFVEEDKEVDIHNKWLVLFTFKGLEGATYNNPDERFDTQEEAEAYASKWRSKS